MRRLFACILAVLVVCPTVARGEDEVGIVSKRVPLSSVKAVRVLTDLSEDGAHTWHLDVALDKGACELTATEVRPAIATLLGLSEEMLIVGEIGERSVTFRPAPKTVEVLVATNQPNQVVRHTMEVRQPKPVVRQFQINNRPGLQFGAVLQFEKGVSAIAQAKALLAAANLAEEVRDGEACGGCDGTSCEGSSAVGPASCATAPSCGCDGLKMKIIDEQTFAFVTDRS